MWQTALLIFTVSAVRPNGTTFAMTYDMNQGDESTRGIHRNKIEKCAWLKTQIT